MHRWEKKGRAHLRTRTELAADPSFKLANAKNGTDTGR